MLIRDPVAERVIGCAIAVHRVVGPGLLESAYHACLACAYRLDFVIKNRVVLDLECVAHLLPVHVAQVITYLKLTAYPVGLLINFCVPVLKEGIRSVVLELILAPRTPNVDPE